MGCIQSKSKVSYDQPVVICGGGIIGCATAYYLAKRGVKSIILEASEIASGASGKAGGFLARNWNEGSPVHELAFRSFDMHMELAKEFSDCDYRRVDALNITAKEGYSRKAEGMCPSWLMHDVEHVSALGTSADTAQVHPKKLCFKFFEQAREMAGTEVRKCQVTGFDRKGNRITGVKLHSGEVMPASQVVLAMGPWCKKLEMKSFGITPIKAHKAASISVENVETTAHAVFMAFTPVACGKHKVGELDMFSVRHTEWYPRPDGTLFISGEEKQDEHLPKFTHDVRPSDAAIRRLRDTLDSVCPDFVKNVTVEQACYLPTTDDSIPLIGKVHGIQGLYIATGHSVWGILNAPVTGTILAELIVDGQCTLLDLGDFEPGRIMGYNDGESD